MKDTAEHSTVSVIDVKSMSTCFHVTKCSLFQWARIVLVVERGVSPAQRLKKLMDYSQPMSDGRRALVLRLNQSVSPTKFILKLQITSSITGITK